MSFTYDSDTKERVRTATDIVDLIGSRLELRRQGRNYVALCPWHADSRPSLQINAEKQIWKCWVCDIGGDAFSFLMRDEGLTFPEALQKLADRAGITLSQTPGQRSQPGRDSKTDLYRALAFAEELFHRYLLESEEGERARRYLDERGITAESIKSFGIGLAPDSWSTLFDRSVKEGLSQYVLEAAGLVIKRDSGGCYDRFRNRLMFPIRDHDQRVIAFGGRVLPGSEEGAKYINSPGTRLFQKNQELYGFDLARDSIRQSRQVVVMEGYTDVIIAHQCGLENSVAVLGTALGQTHLKTLRRYNCDSVVLLLDGDEAGQKRSDDVLELFLHAQLDVRVLTLPEGMDPADFLLQRGLPALQTMIASAADALDFKLRRVTTGFDPARDTHRANQAVEQMLALLAKVPASGLISNDAFRVRQNQLLPRLARQFSIPEETLRDRLTALREQQSRYVQRSQLPPQKAAPLLKPGDLSPFERELLELIIVAPQVAPIALERVQSGWLECEAAKLMLDAYEQLEFSGQSLEFDSVLIALEDPSLKSLLVTLHEQAQAKLKFTRESAEQRLHSLTHRMGEKQDEFRRQQRVLELQNSGLSETEELDVLQDLIRQARLRQGLADAGASQDASPMRPGDVPSPTAISDVPSTEQSPPE